jgi:hypothetical protein
MNDLHPSSSISFSHDFASAADKNFRKACDLGISSFVGDTADLFRFTPAMK